MHEHLVCLQYMSVMQISGVPTAFAPSIFIFYLLPDGMDHAQFVEGRFSLEQSPL